MPSDMSGHGPSGIIVRGWYHAETLCDYAASQTHKSVAYCESADGGKTFGRPGYPNNTVLVGAPFAANMTTGAGDHSVVVVGEHYYMYYGFYPQWKTGVARSKVADGGRPGTWTKLSNGSFSVDALSSSPAPDPLNYIAGTFVTWLPNATALVSLGIGPSGVIVASSLDGLTWTAESRIVLLPCAAPSWVRGASSSERLAYVSIVSDEPHSGLLWLYYLYLRPGDSFDKRFNVRRRLQVLHNQNETETGTSLVTVAQYHSPSAADYWTTIASVFPDKSDYALSAVVGLACAASGGCGAGVGTVAMADCFDAGNATHFVGVGDECKRNGFAELRPLGFAAVEPPPVIRLVQRSGVAGDMLSPTLLVRCAAVSPAGRWSYRVFRSACNPGWGAPVSIGYVYCDDDAC